MAYIELRNIVKTFGDLRANDGIDLDIHRGEIHALLGENGSGKTTLMNILMGRYKNDSGEIFIDGKRCDLKNPHDSIEAGIGMIHQHVELVDSLSLTENIAAGMRRGVLLRKKQLRQRIPEIAEKYGIPIDLNQKTRTLSVSQKQSVEMIKALFRGVRILILDEPTSVLTPLEIQDFFDNLKRIKEDGCAIILITHKMQEVFDVSDRVTVLRKGKSVYTAGITETNRETLTEKMVGHVPGKLNHDKENIQIHIAEPILSVKNLTISGKHGSSKLDQVCFDVYPGEIHGIAGIMGNGQKELCNAIAGIEKTQSGEILYKGKDILGIPATKRSKHDIRISYVPEDRMDSGLVGEMRISGNVMLRKVDSKKAVFYDEKYARKFAGEIIENYHVDAIGPGQPIKNLSGGNIQKILLGREIEEAPDLLILAYPVRGLDIGATDYILNLLASKRSEGMAIIMVGEDIDVLLEICNRISVMYQGTLVATLQTAHADKKEIGALMTGTDFGGPI